MNEQQDDCHNCTTTTKPAVGCTTDLDTIAYGVSNNDTLVNILQQAVTTPITREGSVDVCIPILAD